MTEQDVYLIIKSLKSHSLFFDLTETELLVSKLNAIL